MHLAERRYRRWRDDALADGGDRLVLLELGVGWNTPVWIRYPFEQIARQTGATLICINADPTTMRPSVPLPPQRYLPLHGRHRHVAARAAGIIAGRYISSCGMATDGVQTESF